MPETYIQILMEGGFVHDVSEENWHLLKEEIKSGARFVECEDIYGGECWMIVDKIVTTRRCSPEARATFHEYHKEESYNEE